MNKQIKAIDSIRGIGILAVILIHTTTRVLETSSFNFHNFGWTLFLNQIARFAVPLFFIVSGVVLEISVRKESYWSFFRRRFAKIVIPFVIWSLIYYFFVYNQNHDGLLKVFLTGNASYQLYFIPTLCIYYLLFPLLHKYYKIISNKFVLTILWLSQIALLSYDYYVDYLDFAEPVRIALMSYSFFIIGIIVGKNIGKIDQFIKRHIRILITLSVIAGSYVFLEGRIRYLSTGNYLSFYSQWRPSVFIYSLLVGLTFYYLFEYLIKNTSIISRFSRHSFFVFFIHVAVLEIVWKIFGSKMFTLLSVSVVGRIFIDPIFFVMVTLVSFGIAALVHKIPKSNKIFG